VKARNKCSMNYRKYIEEERVGSQKADFGAHDL
jgi:hypothetical protein